MSPTIAKYPLYSLLLIGILATAACSSEEEGKPMFRVQPEAAGTHCQYGGIRVEYGTDTNVNLRLEDSEVDATQTEYGCAILAKGRTSRVNVVPEPLGTHCANGGYRIESGLDLSDNGTLEMSEVESTAFVCNGIHAVNGMVITQPEPAGTNCRNAGQRVSTGFDRDNSGTLEASEVTANTYVCNGVHGIDAINGIVRVLPEPAGANCGNSGQRVLSGLDTNRSGQLDDSEVTATAFVCNGVNSLTRLGQIPSTHNPGPNQCEFGGTKIDSGLDLNGDRILQSTEVQTTSVVCSIQVIANVIVESFVVNMGDPTTACTQGGVRMTAGIDMNGDHRLQPGEITSSVDICNQIQLIAGRTSLIRTFNATSEQCAWGGHVIQSGLDLNYNNILEASETQATNVVCNGANGVNSLVRHTPDSTPAGCGARGGILFQSGLDNNRNNTLDASEVTQSGFICNGYTGPQGPEGMPSLVRQTADNAMCGPRGGIRIDTGPDINRDNVLQSTEVSYTSYVCNGVNGRDGVDGEDGHSYNSLIYPSVITPGSTCAMGGVRYDSGLDENANGRLEASEIEYSSFVCHGEDGFDGKDGAPGTLVEVGTAGTIACENDGISVRTGRDDNRNGRLEASEVDSTTMLCAP